MRKTLTILFLLCLTAYTWADVCVNQVCYSLDKANATATVVPNAKHPYTGKVTIPSEITHMKRTYTVTRIGEQAFRGCTGMTEIVFPSTLTSVGNLAFSDCAGLTAINLPNSVTNIEDYAFSDCYALTHLVLPEGLKKINDFAFSGCNSLTTLVLPDGLETIGEYAFNRCSKLTMVIVPHSVQTVERKAFAACTNLACVCGRNIVWDNPNSATEVIPYLHLIPSAQVSIPWTTYVRIAMDEEMAKWKQKSQFESMAHYQERIAPKVLDKQSKRFYQTALENYKNYFAEETPQLVSSEVEMEDPVMMNIDNSIDTDIPVTAADNERTFAVVIGNENYKKVSHVDFAQNDAKVFAQYCQKTLGIPQHQVRLYTDITYGDMLMALKDIKAIAQAYDGNIHVIFYYAGHGIPNESSHDAYLLPVDADGTETEVCMPISRLYSELASMSAQSVVVMMDACFSGSQRGEGMLASARGVALKAKAGVPQGNMVVLSAASSDETAFPYREKQHGLFTYFLLKKLQESHGQVSILDLGNYITTQVKQQSVVVNRKSQTPSITPSRTVGDAWRNWQLR